MKLVLTGATGFVGGEVLRQALTNPHITSVVALGRRAVPTTSPKLQSIIVPDLGVTYPADVLAAIKDADACIWALAMMPTTFRTHTPEEVRRVCHDYTLAGLRALGSGARFVYLSGLAVERDQNKRPTWHPDYLAMRGETENALLAARQTGLHIAKPGFVTERWKLRTLAISAMMIPAIDVGVLAAALLRLAKDGSEQDTLDNTELVRIGREVSP